MNEREYRPVRVMVEVTVASKKGYKIKKVPQLTYEEVVNPNPESEE